VDYDLIVIGSGPSGEKGAAQAAYFGKRVALIERGAFCGGAAANTGTLPSKTLRESALHLSGFRKRQLYGAGLAVPPQVDADMFLRHFRQVRNQERERISTNLGRHKVDVYRGTASFIDPHRLCVAKADGSSHILEGGIVLIATGTRPHHPASYPWQDKRLCESDSILRIRRLPQKMLVIGGGVIGSEYACIFSALGAQVTLVDGRSRLMGFLDAEVSGALETAMRNMGMELRLGENVAALESGEKLTAIFEKGGVDSYDAVLVASGRLGNTDMLALDRVGLQVDKRGLLKVDANYATDVPNIYAAGDVIGFPGLASTSMEQGRLAMCHAFGLNYKTNLSRILPLGIYTIPECSSAGETEESLCDKGIPYVVGKADYSNNSRGFIIGDKEGFLKLLFRASDMRLLGVHCIGEVATDLVHTGLTALLLEQGADLFIDTCYNYPTLSEMYKYAAYDALGRHQRGEIRGSKT